MQVKSIEEWSREHSTTLSTFNKVFSECSRDNIKRALTAILTEEQGQI